MKYTVPGNPPKLEQQLRRTRISLDDFKEADEYLEASHGRLTDTRKRALLVAAVVAYARPFMNNRAGSRGETTSTLAANPKKILSSEEVELHHRVISLRNEAVAHSDFDRKPTGRILGNSSGFVMASKPFDLLSQRVPVRVFRSICDKMKKDCVRRLFELNRRISAMESEP